MYITPTFTKSNLDPHNNKSHHTPRTPETHTTLSLLPKSSTTHHTTLHQPLQIPTTTSPQTDVPHEPGNTTHSANKHTYHPHSNHNRTDRSTLDKYTYSQTPTNTHPQHDWNITHPETPTNQTHINSLHVPLNHHTLSTKMVSNTNYTQNKQAHTLNKQQTNSKNKTNWRQWYYMTRRKLQNNK